MSHVEFTKWPYRHVRFSGSDPFLSSMPFVTLNTRSHFPPPLRHGSNIWSRSRSYELTPTLFTDPWLITPLTRAPQYGRLTPPKPGSRPSRGENEAPTAATIPPPVGVTSTSLRDVIHQTLTGACAQGLLQGVVMWQVMNSQWKEGCRRGRDQCTER